MRSTSCFILSMDLVDFSQGKNMRNYTAHTDTKMVFVTLDRMSAIQLAVSWSFAEEWVTSEGNVIFEENELNLLLQELEYSGSLFSVHMAGEGRNTLGQDAWSKLQLEKGRITVLNEDYKPVEVLYGTEFVTHDPEELVRRVAFLAKAGMRDIKVRIDSNSFEGIGISAIRGFLEPIMAQRFKDGCWYLDLSLTLD